MAVISFFGDQSQTYELYAVVDHVGDLRSGLYSARIKIEEEHGDRWYNFDDPGVTEVRLLVFSSLLLKHITKQPCCTVMYYRGGERDRSYVSLLFPSQLDYQPFQVDNTEKYVFVFFQYPHNVFCKYFFIFHKCIL